MGNASFILSSPAGILSVSSKTEKQKLQSDIHMILKPRFHKRILNQPYQRGVATGILLGCGMTWITIAFINHLSIDKIAGIIVFFIGSVEYLLQIREDYNFIK